MLKEAFRLVSQWWHEEEATWVSRYEAKTYPAVSLGRYHGRERRDGITGGANRPITLVDSVQSMLPCSTRFQ